MQIGRRKAAETFKIPAIHCRFASDILRQRVANEWQIGIEDRGIEARHVPRRMVGVSCAIAARTVSWWTPSAAAMVPTFQCSPEIQAANLGVLLGGDHGAPPRTRDGSPGRWRSHALSRPQTIQRNAPARGAVGDRSVDVSAGSVVDDAARREV
jgi:hypothetical protein